MKLKNFKTLFFLFYLILTSCASREVIYNDPVELLNDDFWINNDTLQIQVEAVEEENIPYSLRREKACEKAKSNIKNVFETRYPKAIKFKYKTYIYKMLYTEKNNCRLVVHIHKKNLKDVLK